MKKRVVFSAVEGQVLERGKPVAGLEVTQRWSWFFVDDGTATTKTDAKGRFRFPEVSVRKARLPSDVMVVQDLEVVRDGKKVSLWSLTRRDVEANGELGGVPVVLTAELTSPPREQKVAVKRDELATVSGVSTFPHPYLERWEAVRAKVTEQGVAQALTRFLGSEEGAKGLEAFLPAIGAKRARVTGVVSVKDVVLTDGFLFTAPKAGAFAVEGKGPRFVGFCTRAQVRLALDSGAQLDGGFFAWTLYLPLDDDGQPRWEAQFSDRWEVDLRPWVRQQVEAVLDRKKLSALVHEALERSPGAQPLEVLAAPGRKGKKATLGVEAVELSDVAVDGSKDDWASVRVAGTLALSGREVRPRFRGNVSLTLASLDRPAYALASVSAPHFAVVPFKVVLGTDKKSSARGAPIVLRFEVENLLDTPQRFLKWHTPFEGFMNDFLEVKSVEGDEVHYSGPLVSRGPPDDDDYLVLEPGAKARCELELTQCYPVKKAGTYLLRYKPLGEAWAEEARFTVK